jgi:GTP cyclohydrolase II
MEMIHQAGWGCVVYLRQEGRGIGLREKIKAYHLQDEGVDTLDANIILGHPADARDYRIAAEILKAINITEVSLLTNNPDKVEQMNNLGIEVVDQLPLVVGVGADNLEYLSTKVQRMGHSIDLDSINDIK